MHADLEDAPATAEVLRTAEQVIIEYFTLPAGNGHRTGGGQRTRDEKGAGADGRRSCVGVDR